MEEFVLNFGEEGSITPIDVVMDVTGLTYDEIKSCCSVIQTDLKIDYTNLDGK